MKNLLTLQSDYSKNGSYIQLALPIHTEVLIPVDDSVRLIDQVLEEIDYRELYLTYSSEGRNPAVSLFLYCIRRFILAHDSLMDLNTHKNAKKGVLWVFSYPAGKKNGVAIPIKMRKMKFYG